MALQGEDTSATFASIAAYTSLNWTLVHLNMAKLFNPELHNVTDMEDISV